MGGMAREQQAESRTQALRVEGQNEAGTHTQADEGEGFGVQGRIWGHTYPRISP
jgi:hypothetical protein